MILFVILTCEKYIYNRCEWQKNTWLTKIGEECDYIYLSSKPDIKNKIIGYSTNDTYEFATLKYVEFFKNYNLNEYFDYIFFCDDDTFVNPFRLKEKINELGNFDCYCRIGNTSNNISLINNDKNYFPLNFPSGGAGFLITKNVFFKIKNYIINENFPVFLNGDVTFGSWFKDNGIVMIEGSDLLKSQNPEHKENENLKDFISQHYCNEKHFLYLFNRINNI